MSVNGRHEQCTLPDGNCGQNVLNSAMSFDSDTQNTDSHGVFRIMTKQNYVCNQPTNCFHRREIALYDSPGRLPPGHETTSVRKSVPAETNSLLSQR